MPRPAPWRELLPRRRAQSASAEAQGLKKFVQFSPIADDPRIRMKSLNSQEVFMI